MAPERDQVSRRSLAPGKSWQMHSQGGVIVGCAIGRHCMYEPGDFREEIDPGPVMEGERTCALANRGAATAMASRECEQDPEVLGPWGTPGTG